LQASRNEYKPHIASESNKSVSTHLKPEIKKWAIQKWPEYELEESYLPYFDLIVKKEGRPLGALFTDDNQYHQSLSVKADHAIYPQLLELKHWPYLRVFTRNLWQDPDKFYNEVSKFLTQ
jgi:hypothetical protein